MSSGESPAIDSPCPERPRYDVLIHGVPRMRCAGSCSGHGSVRDGYLREGVRPRAQPLPPRRRRRRGCHRRPRRVGSCSTVPRTGGSLAARISTAAGATALPLGLDSLHDHGARALATTLPAALNRPVTLVRGRPDCSISRGLWGPPTGWAQPGVIVSARSTVRGNRSTSSSAFRRRFS
jgi:hypothetical protein